MKGFWDGSGISWTICKQSAPRSRQITTPTPHHSILRGRMLFLMSKHWRQAWRSAAIARMDSRPPAASYVLSGRSLRRDCYMPTVHCNKSRDSRDVLKKLCHHRKLRHQSYIVRHIPIFIYSTFGRVCVTHALVQRWHLGPTLCWRITILRFFSDFKNVTFYGFLKTCQKVVKSS